VIRARFHLDGSRLTITTNGNERADPIRREQLERLLASFDAIDPPPGAITMRTDHLGKALRL
jgi:hypothetical protein